MKILLRFALALMALGVALIASQSSATASTGQLCTVSLDRFGVVAIEITPPVEGRLYRVWRHGHQIELENSVHNAEGAIVAFIDLYPLNRSVVHYSIQSGTQGDTAKVYCGSVRPTVGSCSVSVVDGVPVIEWQNRSAAYIARNGARIKHYTGSDARLDSAKAGMFADEGAGIIDQRSHYSVEWVGPTDIGERTYCGMAETTGGQPITCELSMYSEGSPYVRIRSQELAEKGGMEATPGRAVVYRDGRIISTNTFPDETEGRLDQDFTANKAHQYSLGWINQQNEFVVAPVPCGSITPPPPFKG